MAFNFGTPASTAGGSAFSFGASATTPAFGTPASNTTNVSFSTPAATTSGFGGFGGTTATAATPPQFGAAAAAPNLQTTTPSFGTAAPSFGSTFSTPPQTTLAAPSTFGASSFGAAAAAPSFGGLSAAAAPATSVAPSSIGLSFPSFGATTATTAAPAAATLPSFGAAAATAASIGAFGAKPTTNVQPLNFGAAAAGSATAPPPAFGQSTLGMTGLAATTATTTTNAAPPVSFNFSGTTTPAASTGLSFGLPAAATTSIAGAVPTPASSAAPSQGFALSLPTTAPSAGGLFGPKPATNVPLLLFGSTATTAASTTVPNLFSSTATTQPLLGATLTTAAPSFGGPSKIGLGGVDSNATAPKTIGEGRSESGRVKELQLPMEIVNTVEALKGHIKQQKQFSSDIARTSTHKLFNVSTELQNLNWALTEVSNCVETNYATIKLLRDDTAVAIRQAEMAKRTHEIQPGLQFENTAPLQFFMDLVQKYESDMITFRNQVEMTEKHMRSLANPQSFSADDLKKGLKQIHESFVALAGRVHETHQKVEAQKEQYLNLRKHLLKDKTNVFETELGANEKVQTMANISCGPTPFSATFGINLGVTNTTAGVQTSTSSTSMQHQPFNNNTFGFMSQQPSGATTNASFGFQNFGGAATTNFSNPNNNSSASSTFNADGTFNLQKPPVGSKRNKQ